MSPPPCVFSFADTTLPVKVPTKPLPDHANLIALGSLTSARPTQRTPAATADPPPAAPAADVEPPFAAEPPVADEPPALLPPEPPAPCPAAVSLSRPLPVQAPSSHNKSE